MGPNNFNSTVGMRRNDKLVAGRTGDPTSQARTRPGDSCGWTNGAIGTGGCEPAVVADRHDCEEDPERWDGLS